MKILALYLPQFHNIPENNEWWGPGFTEWTNVKGARPLYEGHRQPMVPLDCNYYDLTDPRAIVWQHELASNYGIDGFIYYHYWFNGRLLLEKPAEMLLDIPDANREFCFCWANESWTKSWDGKTKEVILEQTFGGIQDWSAHLEYLLPFFRDCRYLRENGHPVFFVYSPNRIPCFDEMVQFWNQRLCEVGEKELYIVEFLNSFNPKPFSNESSAVMEFEPLFSSNFGISQLKRFKRFVHKGLKLTDYLDYDYIWNRILENNAEYADKSIIRSCFTRFDNSPRRGRSAFITRGATPEKFEYYFSKLLGTPRVRQSDLVVINAWNEWGEGAILEPSEQDGYKWLEAVRSARMAN